MISELGSNGMSFIRKWRNYQRIAEAVEETPFKSPAQKRYKKQRRRNDIYTTRAGHKSKKSGSPFTGKVRRFGTSRLRFEGLQEKIEASALKSFEAHDTLEPEIWDEDGLNSEVRQALIKIVGDFLIDLEFDVDPEDITLTGSLANYNWSKYSDIDLHILVDYDDIDENEKLVRDYFRNVSTNWNRTHNITIKGHPVEVYVQDSKEPHYSTGIYSVKYDKWDRMPSKYNPKIDYANIKKKAAGLMEDIDEVYELFAEKDYKAAVEESSKLKERIRLFRQAGLEEGGEYSNENLVFKLLRRNEYLRKLSSLKILSYDKMMSVNGGIESEIIKIGLKENN